MKKINEYQKKIDKMLSESVKKTSKSKADAKWDKQIKKIRSTGGTKNHTFTESNDEVLKININTYPWYFKKIDSTHFYMANNEKAIKSGAAMAHHVGQHRGEDYYKDLVSWLKGGIPTKKLYGKGYKGNG